jgi:hypothetical protein
MEKEIKTLLSRRFFIKLSSLSAALPLVSLKGFASAGHSSDKASPKNEHNKAYYFDKKTRLTIAMWDFTYLTAHHKGGAYESLERCVAEAAERGYNTLRIDCFPSRILEGKSVFKKNFTPGTKLPFWGQTSVDHELNVLEKLSALAKACRKYNIWLGLDSWEKGHMINNDNINPLVINNIIRPDEEEKVFDKFTKIWVKALKLMREEGVLESAVWVAPMNEVPHFCSRSLQSIREINSKVHNEGETVIEVDRVINDKYKQINAWLGEALKDEIKKDKIPLSYSSVGAEEYAKRLTDIYDVVDVHFMPGLILKKEQSSAFEKLGKGASGVITFAGYEKLNLKEFSQLWDATCRNNYPEMLSRIRDYFHNALNHLTLPEGKKLQAVITESYGPVFWPDHPDVSWDWYKKYNADAARIAASMPFAGVSLSNFAEPLFTLWNDIDWHRNSNVFTLNIL